MLSFSLAASVTAAANNVSTGFEFINTSGEFSMGGNARRATFFDGRAETVGVAALYRTGTHAWLVSGGVRARIEVGVPSERLEFWFRDENAGVASVVRVLDLSGSIIATYQGSSSAWTHVLHLAPEAVSRVEIDNNGMGRVAVDDFRYCAPQPIQIGTNYCGPAVPNSQTSQGEMTAFGTQEVAINDLHLEAHLMASSSTAMFITSRDAGFVVNPGGSQGHLCLGGSIGRYAGDVMSTGASGSMGLQIDLNAMPQPTGIEVFLPGETWRFQAWYRDVVGGVPTSNFTDGLEVTLF